MLGVEPFNQELRSAITETELQLRELDDAGSLTTEKAVGMTQAYHLDLGPLAFGSRPRHIWVTFSNDGPLPVTWELHSFDDREVCDPPSGKTWICQNMDGALLDGAFNDIHQQLSRLCESVEAAPPVQASLIHGR